MNDAAGVEAGAPDVAVRRAHPGDEMGIARAQVAGWRMAYRGIIAGATLHSLPLDSWTEVWRERLTALAADPPPRMQACCVAMDTLDAVVGFAHGGRVSPLASGETPVGYDAELYAIYMTPGCEGRGVGRLLARAVAERLATDGLRALLVWALKDNPYRRFYEALGGEVIAEREITVFGQSLQEIGYGWSDIQTLVARGAPGASPPG